MWALPTKKLISTNLPFDNQWNGEFFDNKNISNLEPIAYNSVTYLDLQLGLNYAYFPSDNSYF